MLFFTRFVRRVPKELHVFMKSESLLSLYKNYNNHYRPNGICAAAVMKYLVALIIIMIFKLISKTIFPIYCFFNQTKLMNGYLSRSHEKTFRMFLFMRADYFVPINTNHSYLQGIRKSNFAAQTAACSL